jgi:hypothetical protein
MNILHLSDLHFGRNYECYGINEKFSNKDRIISEILICIKNIEDGYKPEHIVVTGDIAWHGMKEEFEEAEQWFSRLLDVTGLNGKNLTFCVGNHDVNRSFGNVLGSINDDSIQEIDEKYDYSNIHEFEAPIYEYDKFCERLAVEPFMYPVSGKIDYSYSVGYKDVIFPSGNKIRLCGFNTAMLSFSSNISPDKMWIGQSQIIDLMRYGILPHKEDVHYSIALFHHAERFLHPNEICEYNERVASLPLLLDEVNLALCGHTETGGRPVLKTQAGGGKLLTAGATYYNDQHPNAFSMIYIADNKEEMCFQPFAYDNGWKKYEYINKISQNIELEELQPIGDIKDECKFIVRADEKTYEIPLKRISFYPYSINNTQFCKIDNRKEVLRKLNIEYDGPVFGGNADVKVELAPKMKRVVAAMLERERYFSFIAEHLNGGHKTEFYIENSQGIRLLSGCNLKADIELGGTGIDILKKMVKIERFFDVKFVRPDDLYELDNMRIDLLIGLIDNGYTRGLKLGKTVNLEFNNNDEMTNFYQEAVKDNEFLLQYEGDFVCDIFGVKINFGRVLILAGIYKVDLDDLKYKIKTFKEYDLRILKFDAISEIDTYFVSDIDKAGDKVSFEKEYKVLALPKRILNFGFIYEEL